MSGLIMDLMMVQGLGASATQQSGALPQH
jgi:hypothetical protein